jgi:hypothetical protein
MQTHSKSGLTEAMMKARYHFCMRYKERKERYQRRKAGRRPGGSEVEVDEVKTDEEVDEDW